jgi:hypothetical protein
MKDIAAGHVGTITRPLTGLKQVTELVSQRMIRPVCWFVDCVREIASLIEINVARTIP